MIGTIVFVWVIVVWLGGALLAGWIARDKGRDGTGFALVALVIPLFGIIAAACAQPDPEAMKVRREAAAKLKDVAEPSNRRTRRSVAVLPTAPWEEEKEADGVSRVSMHIGPR